MKEITEKELIENLSGLKNKILFPKNIESINFNRKNNSNRHIINNILIATGCFIFVLFIGNTHVFSETVKRIFYSNTVNKGVIIAEKNNSGLTTINKTVTDNGIKVKLNGVICDGIKTVISIRFESNKISFNSAAEQNLILGKVSLIDADGTAYQLNHYGQGETTPNQNYYNTSMEFTGSPQKNTLLTLKIASINNISGKWNFIFNANPTIPSTSKVSSTKIQYTNNKICLTVTSVTFTSTSTIVEGTIKYDNFNFASTLTNSNGDIAEQTDADKTIIGKNDTGNFKIYFSPIPKTNKLVLKINSFADNSKIIDIEINLDKL